MSPSMKIRSIRLVAHLRPDLDLASQRAYSIEPYGSRTKWYAMTDPLTRTFGALADPTRRAILARLAQGEASVAELAEPFEMTVRAISKHIAVLERAGLVSRGKEAQRRPSKLEVTPLREIDAWLVDYRALWERRLAAVDHVLTQIKQGKLRDPRRK